MDELHSLLKRQLKRRFGQEFTIPAEWQGFINSINAAYYEFDSDREMLERSLEISSQELIQANAETRSIIQLFPDAFLWLNQDGKILNYKSSEQTGADWLQEYLNVPHIQEMQPGTIKDVLHQAIHQSIDTKLVSSIGFFISRQRKVKYYEARVIPPLSNRVLVIIRDVTEQKLAEEKVIESERRFRELADLLPIVIFESNLKGELAYFNNLAHTLLGYDEKEALGKPIFRYIAPEDRERSTVNFRNILYGENLGMNEYVAIKDTDIRFPVLIQTLPIINNHGELTGIRGIMVDISERKRIEKELQESEIKYRSLVENIKLGIFRTNAGNKGRFIEVNQAMEEITGYTRDELLNLEVVKLYAHQEDRKEFLNQLALTPEKASLTTHLVKKDRTHITVSIISKAIQDETGKVIFADGTIEDITDRVKMEDQIVDLYEKEKNHRELLQAEAKSRGMFIDVLAHELRTPLTPIMASTGVLQDLAEKEDNVLLKRLSNNINNSTQILAKRLEELLDIARYSRGTFKLAVHPVEITTFLHGAIMRFKPYMEQHKQQLVEDLPENSIMGTIDNLKLEQVIINLLSNASKFSPDQGTVHIRVSIENQALQVDVTDHGIGISIESQQRLFEPYHRVEQDRQQFTGLGLGLAVSKQIVEAHKGKIWVVSQPGEGSTFSFRIPLNHA